ncbi:MAG: methyltransferase domain-containing protein [Verrucomicrobia bacterium]|nr:methyltransferase domain-containing protein [Verrucomicrobiota bacterium]
MTQPSQSHYYAHDLEAMSAAGNYHRWILEEFAPFLGNRVVEVGAGSGAFSELLLGQSIQSLAAFEPSDNLFPTLAANLGGDRRARAFHAILEDRVEEIRGQCDCVLYVNVLEHVEDAPRELELVQTALVAGGHVCIFVPALTWLYSELDRKLGHFRRYHRAPLRQVVEHAGFEIIKLKYFDLPGILPWYLAFTLLRGSFSRGKVSLYDRLIVPLARSVERRWPPPVGKNLLCVARKPPVGTPPNEQ